MTPSSNMSRKTGHSRDFPDKISELRKLLGELAKSAPAVAGEAFDDLRRQASEIWDCSENTQAHASKAALKAIKLHPFQIMFVAMVSGFLAWWLITRNQDNAENDSP